MIREFRDKETQKIFNLEFSRKFPREIQERAYHKLVAIHEAESLENLRCPPAIASKHLEEIFPVFTPFESINSGVSSSDGTAPTHTK